MFLKNDMIRESSVRREINLEEKRAYAPIPMVEEHYFSIPAETTPPVQTTVVASPVVDVGVSSTQHTEQELILLLYLSLMPQRCTSLQN